MSAKVVFVLEGVHMGTGHIGLAKLIKSKAKIEIEDLGPGTMVMLLNTKGDKLKVIGGYGLVIGYLRMPKGQRIYKEALQYLPSTFGASGFDYSKAVQKALEARIYKAKPRATPLVAAERLRAQ